MYAVTGATGQFGRLAIAALVKRVGAGNVVALARDPARADDLAARGVSVRPFDYDRPDSPAEALSGVERLLLVSSNDVEGRIPQHRAVVDAAVAAGVPFIAYTSVLNADVSPMSVAPSHRDRG